MTAPGVEASAPGRAAALLGRPASGAEPGPGHLRWAAGLLHDLVVWGLDQGVPDLALRPLEARLAAVAAELAPADPGLATLIDWWVTAVIGLRPHQLWYVHPLPEELAQAILPGGWPPNLGAEVKLRRFTEDIGRLTHLAATVPVLSQVAKAQAVVRDFNSELNGVLAGLAGGAPLDPDAGRHLAERSEALLRGSGVVEGSPLHAKVRRQLQERVALAGDLAARAGSLGEAFAPLPASRVKALTRLVRTGDSVLAGRLLAALGGPPPRPEPSGLAVALEEVLVGLGEDDRFRAHRLLGRVAEAVAEAAGDKELAGLAEEGRSIEAGIVTALEELEPHAAGDVGDLPALIRLALERGELAEARSWLTDLTTSVQAERARREATKALDRARNRGVAGELVDALAAALQGGDMVAMTQLSGQVRLLPGMDRRLTALAETTPPAAGPAATAGRALSGSTVTRGWPEGLPQPPVAKATAAYVIRVNAHNRFFDGRICAAPAGNRNCASSERFKLDFCEKGVKRCAWLAAFAEQPRVELTDPFVDEYQPVLEESPPQAGDVAVLWSTTETGNELVGLWRVLTLARARRGWVLNGDRDAAILLPRGLVPWSALYRRWSSPRGSLALRTLDVTGLEGLLIEVREALTPLAESDPTVQRDLAALEMMLADQRGRLPEPANGSAPAAAVATRAATTLAARAGAASAAGAAAAEPGEAQDGPARSRPRRGRRDKRAAPPTLHERIRARGGFYPPALVAQYQLALAESRLVILAGPSGTGKTRLAGDAAAELGAAFCLVAVRPDWHANEDLLGYLPPFPGARFAATPASTFIRAAAVEVEAAAAEGRPARAFHLCLDEMNLARPEHYLAELLSKMELPDGRIAFHPGTGESESAGFPAEVAYPSNLVIIGTVNLDETTLPVSVKVLDRAAYLVVEAHELKAFLEHLAESGQVPAWVPRLVVDIDGVLDDAGQGLGYRVAHRLLRWAALGAGQGHSPEESLDWALAAQVLPRLRFTRSDPSHLEVLEALVGRLQGATGGFPRSVALLERMLAELRRQDFTLGQMRLS